MSEEKRVAVLGVGKLGESITRALLDSGTLKADQMVGTAKHQETLDAKADLGIRLILDDAEAARDADIILLVVKPQVMGEVIASIAPVVRSHQLVVTAAAGVSTTTIQEGLAPNVPVVRAMPNTPCLVRAGMTAISAGAHATDEHLDSVRQLFEAMGRVIALDERHMDAVTGLSGSGPAFMYLVMEALTDGGLKVGLPRHVATELVAQTMLGAAQLALTSGEHPAQLKDAVTTPAGCTIDGLLELEDGGLRVALIKAVVQTSRRAGELGKE